MKAKTTDPTTLLRDRCLSVSVRANHVDNRAR